MILSFANSDPQRSIFSMEISAIATPITMENWYLFFEFLVKVLEREANKSFGFFVLYASDKEEVQKKFHDHVLTVKEQNIENIDVAAQNYKFVFENGIATFFQALKRLKNISVTLNPLYNKKANKPL